MGIHIIRFILWSIRIYCGSFVRAVYLATVNGKSVRALEQWRPTGRQKHLYLHHQGEFSTKIVRLVSSYMVAITIIVWYSQNRCRAFVNSHRTPGSRGISPAGQAHPSEWYFGIHFHPEQTLIASTSTYLQLQGCRSGIGVTSSTCHVAVSFPADPERKKNPPTQGVAAQKDKSHNSTTKISFCTNIIRLG